MGGGHFHCCARRRICVLTPWTARTKGVQLEEIHSQHDRRHLRAQRAIGPALHLCSIRGRTEDDRRLSGCAHRHRDAGADGTTCMSSLGVSNVPLPSLTSTPACSSGQSSAPSGKGQMHLQGCQPFHMLVDCETCASNELYCVPVEPFQTRHGRQNVLSRRQFRRTIACARSPRSSRDLSGRAIRPAIVRRRTQRRVDFPKLQASC